MRHRRWIVVGSVAVVGLMASLLPAKPGTVRTKDGTVFTGDLTEDEKFVTVKNHGISTRIDKRNVPADGIQYTASLDDQFNQRKAQLAATDVKGRIELANWASQNQRPDLAVTALEEARKIDPTNRDAALLLDTAQRQVELDQAHKPPAAGGGAATHAAAGGPSAPAPASQPAPVGGGAAGVSGRVAAAEHRQLNADEINIIRQKEMQLHDPRVQVRFQNEVVKKFLSTGDRDADAFRKLSTVDQATEILDHGDPALAPDVRLTTDPTPIAEFRTRIYPLVANSCGSIACHGGNKGGDFGLFPGESPATVYTNFYILQTYTKTINGVQYTMMDRTRPEQSLVLQYALPSNIAEVVHPQAAGYRPRFRSRSEPGYTQISDWLGQTLNPIAPAYGIKVSPKLPATQPSGK
jgi:hypothetical protein